MLSRRQESAPEFLNEKDARKRAERQAMLDAMENADSTGTIAWPTGQPPHAPDPAPVLSTPRIRLRPWTDADRAPFAAMTSNPEVMRHFPTLLTRGQSDAWIDRAMRKMADLGWGFWALDYLAPEASTPQFAGFTGLNTPEPELPIGPCVEVGWRLSPAFWGLGLASEAARLALRAGFETLGLQEIVAVTTLRNLKSQAVMKRLGMQESPDDAFDHPSFPADSPERHCCIYRLPRALWLAAQ